MGDNKLTAQAPSSSPSTALSDITFIKSDPSSAISELQEAFGHILAARKDRKTSKHTDASTTGSSYPSWTGAFELFSFPRELRDRIYYHFLYRPKGIKYRRKTHQAFPFEQPADIASLFLTSRQVYDEALQVFCRYNQINMPRRSGWRKYDHYAKEVNGMLRLFPDKPARLLQRLRMEYLVSSTMYVTHDHMQVSNEHGAEFTQMLRDAYTCKATFPKLREFTLVWQIRPMYRDTHSQVEFPDKSEEEKKVIWLRWMRDWVREGNVVPPKWVRFEFVNYWDSPRRVVHERAITGAYAMLVAEMRGVRDEDAELEESRRRWLEELESEGRSRKGRKKKHSS
jgi:hypothetical protein